MTDEELVQDPATTALDRLADVADASATDLREVQHELNSMQTKRERGWSWRQIISASDTPQVLATISRIAANLGTASGGFRRALAKRLRSDGMRVTAIADLFAVSRQRVTALIRPDSETEVEL